MVAGIDLVALQLAIAAGA
ncbi:MAG: hypothetical protein AAGK32_05400, partial [Actinomycetota bacterium]